MTSSKQILLTILIFFIIISSSGFVVACASNSTQFGTEYFCCLDLCVEPYYPGVCELVVACQEQTPTFVSEAYADANTLEIKDDCGVCVESINPTTQTCNTHDLNYYSCGADDCQDPDGQTPAPVDGCTFDEIYVFENYYYCLVNESATQSVNQISNCDESTPPADEFNIYGTLEIDAGSSYFLPLETFVIDFTGDYSDYLIDSVGSFDIIGVASGNYLLSFTNAEISEDECISCNSPPQSVSVVDDNVYITDNIIATCIIVDPNVCSGYTPPPPPDECTVEGECNPATNSICENDSWVGYDLSLPSNFSYYCDEDRCEAYDPECTDLTCQTSIICDGVCPPNCWSPTEDPDCGIGGCNFTNTYHRWCNQTLGDWMEYDNPLSPDFYCDVCSQDWLVCGGGDCGDGVVEPTYGEQCDYGNGSGGWHTIYGTGTQLCVIEECSPPADLTGCTCDIIQGICGDGTLNPGEQCGEEGQECGLGYECDYDTCTCNLIDPECGSTAESAIDSISVSVVPCTHELNIRVNLVASCGDDIDEIKLFDCTGPCSEIGIGNVVSTGGEELPYANFTFTVNQYNHVYNFSAAVHFSDGWTEISTEDAKTHRSGDEDCVDWGANPPSCLDGWCDNNNATQCNSTNHLIIGECQLPNTCHINAGIAECTTTPLIDECDSCMGITGMFYTPDYETPENNDCGNLFNPPENVPSDCYFDVRYSNVNKAYSCLYTSSCYDYHSNFACDDDPCKIGIGDACQWVPYNIQTGQGVCRPATPELEDCSQALSFNSNNVFLYTEIFAGLNFSALSSRVCNLYGSCYYKQGFNSNNPAVCKSSNEVICNDFPNQQECTGGTNFSLDTINNLEVINYSSNIISAKAKCKWDNTEDKCIRDTNDDGYEDNSNHELFAFMSPPYKKVSHNDITAQRDFISPNTTIDIDYLPDNNLFGMSVEIPFNIDDTYPIINVSTFYCVDYLDTSTSPPNYRSTNQYQPEFIPSNSECNFTDGNWGPAQDLSLSKTLYLDGNYTMYFFSMDDALNIERLQAIDFRVNTQIPVVEMNYSYVTYPAINYRSTLSIDFRVVSSYSHPLTDCIAYLYEYDPTNPINIIEGPPVTITNTSGVWDNFSVTYTGLSDNTYFFNITCTDTILLGNTMSNVSEILIDGDTRIYDVEPHYEVFKTESMDYSLKTHNNATCYYMWRQNDITIQNTFSEIYDCVTSSNSPNRQFGDISCGIFDRTFSAGIYTHEKNDIDFSDPFNASGVYVYDTACNISSYNSTTKQYDYNIVQGNDNDRIIFSQDYNPPIVNLYVKDNENGAGYDNYAAIDTTHYYNIPQINASCIDDPTFDPIFGGGTSLFTVFNRDLSFGCIEEEEVNQNEDLFYCTLPYTSGTSCPPGSKINPFEDEPFIDPDIQSGTNSGGHTQVMCTYGKDNHTSNPNVGETLCRNISYDGVDPNITDFKIVRQHGSGEPIDIITKAFYYVIVDVDEPLNNNLNLISISFDVLGQGVSDELPFVYNPENNTLTAVLNMFDYPDLNGIELGEVTMDFSVNLVDAHNRENDISGYDYLSYPIDTSLPSAPILEPLFGSFHKDVGVFHDIIGNAYPVVFHEENTVKDHTAYANESFDLSDGFYSNQEDIFITGFVTDEDPINISLLSCDQTEDLQFYTTVLDEYDQSLHTGVNEISDLWEFSFGTHNSSIIAVQGQNLIHLNDQLSPNQQAQIIGTYKYVKLPVNSNDYSSDKAYGKQTTYGNYFKYYIVTGVILDDSVSSDPHHIINVSPALEEDLLPDSQIEFYYSNDIENRPDDYFELNLLTSYEFGCDIGIGSNLYTLRARSIDVNGLLNDTENINYLIDTVAPKLRHVFSAPAGTTSVTTPTLVFNITEHSCGSGLFLGNAELILTNVDTGDTFNYDLGPPLIGPAEKANLVHYAFTYPILPALSEAQYEVSLLVEDYAGNKVVLEDNEWIIDIDTLGTNKPIVNVPESNSTYNSWNKIYFVDEVPSLELLSVDFSEVSEVSVRLMPGNIGMDCIYEPVPLTEGKFLCSIQDDTLSEQIYKINITAIGEEGGEIIGQWDDIKLAYDATVPDVIDLDIPLAIRPNDQRVFKIYLGEPEVDIISRVSYLNDSYELEDMSSDLARETFAAYLDSTYFGWVESLDPYNFSVTIFDRAMNSITFNKSIYVDNTSPEINITRFESGGISFPTGGNPLNNFSNITTRNTTIFINGTVTDSLIRDICLNITIDGTTTNLDEPCQEVCVPPDVPPGCIESGTGNFQFSFILSFNNLGEGMWWNLISLIATDEAFNQEVETLAALMDWLPPEFVNIGGFN